MNSFKHLSNLSSVMAQDLLLLVHGKLCLSTMSFGVLQLTQQLIQKKRKIDGRRPFFTFVSAEFDAIFNLLYFTGTAQQLKHLLGVSKAEGHVNKNYFLYCTIIC